MIKSIVHNDSKKTIAANVKKADSIPSRLKGLLFTKELPENQALVITPCKQVHMFFMGYPIDVVFCDNSGNVIKTLENLKPWRVSPYVFSANYAIELTKGSIEKFGINEGDKLELVSN